MLAIFPRVILPLVVIAGLGFALRNATKLDLRTLSRVNVYLLAPCFLFDSVYHFELRLADAGTAALFTSIVMVIMCVLGVAAARTIRLNRSLSAAFVVSVVFCNSGNYGLSVMELVFGRESPAMQLQGIVFATQNITNFTIGVVVISGGTRSPREALMSALRYPIIPAIVAAALLRGTGLHLPMFLDLPITRVGSAIVPIGLATLGAQVAEIRRAEGLPVVGLAGLLRLVVSPVVGFLLARALGLSGLVAQALVISSAMPTALNTALLSIEFRNEQTFASQAVLFSTLASMLTVSGTIAFAVAYF